jgi:phosphoadenosine phosphosulfate reductase
MGFSMPVEAETLPPDAAALNARYGHLAGEALLRPMIDEFRGRICLVSSFGAEAAVLLHMVAAVDRDTPVLFLDTQKHFPETLAYRDTLVAQLGLTDVRSLTPDAETVAARDPDGTLWSRNPDACCALRKVVPLNRALAGFSAWISGRKRFHGGERRALPVIEPDGPRIKLNPLASWGAAEIACEFATRGLPPHPLVAEGYRSIGCAPCTKPGASAADPRAGRWAGLDKTECGIHESWLSSGL